MVSNELDYFYSDSPTDVCNRINSHNLKVVQILSNANSSGFGFNYVVFYYKNNK